MSAFCASSYLSPIQWLIINVKRTTRARLEIIYRRKRWDICLAGQPVLHLEGSKTWFCPDYPFLEVVEDDELLCVDRVNKLFNSSGGKKFQKLTLPLEDSISG